jgi:hypothetical protein
MLNERFTIEYELCWRADKQPNSQPLFRPQEYRSPTWSWASIKGRISYRYPRDNDVTGDTQLAFVERAEIEIIDGTPTGPVKSGLTQAKRPFIEKQNWSFDPL